MPKEGWFYLILFISLPALTFFAVTKLSRKFTKLQEQPFKIILEFSAIGIAAFLVVFIIQQRVNYPLKENLIQATKTSLAAILISIITYNVNKFRQYLSKKHDKRMNS
jgi:hypothetical protein